MNVLLISQCSKKALAETRRVLDHFAERKGDRTWQTSITQQGLTTLRQMLKKTARRNTAVACHRIGGKNFSELLWIVGSVSKFNVDGTVPTNTTGRDILRSKDENTWHTAEAISLLAGISGLFHDFGKANKLFQEKLKDGKRLSEPYRHEWVSLRLFQAFVREQSDQEWLARLATVSASEEELTLTHLIKDAPELSPNPFKKLPPLATAVGWLIVSHHKLPSFQKKMAKNGRPSPKVESIDGWLTGKGFNSFWNSPQCDGDWSKKELNAVWDFGLHGTPLRSETWCSKAQALAGRALKHPKLFESAWLEDRFSSHLARLSLMLADHCYSADQPRVKWQSKKYKAYANTDRETRQLKQKLDEHNVGVGHNAFLFAKSLPLVRQSLPSITRHKAFKRPSKVPKFRWQDKAYELARALSERSERQGFFGVNMASTGCGKTFANARIMYGLANEKLGCRFSVALGLRTLTLQTGDALQERLQLESDDLAVLIGSQAVRELHDMNKQTEAGDDLPKGPLTPMQAGSESAEALLDEHQYLRYDGSLDDGRLKQWLERTPKLHQLVSAPVLVSTIDHLIPATEGERGGKQIAPMLRLLTSDLVLDEPDDFGLEDLPALARLVNWAGVLGARVLLSSATLPPSLIEALFDAYSAGRRCYAAACGEPSVDEAVVCAWFDEFDRTHGEHRTAETFAEAHQQFVGSRLSNLSKNRPLRRAELLDINSDAQDAPSVAAAMANVIGQAINRLHLQHHQAHEGSGKNVSIGLVRMANIDAMVAVTQRLLAEAPANDCRIHFCIYHSQHPLLMRSNMEAALDRALDRRDAAALWHVPAVKRAINERPEKHQIFVVFATAVAEVGRDHDYDWAVVEPSSMRSLIQLAGRIQRHRQQEPKTANMLVLNQNLRALRGAKVAYTRPGFESEHFCLISKRLDESLLPEQYQTISATPRIQSRQSLDPAANLVDLEHAHLQAQLFGDLNIPLYASLWWQHSATWCAELQRQTPFRKSTGEDECVLYMDEEGENAAFHRFSDKGEILPVENELFRRDDPVLGDRVEPWIAEDAAEQILALAENMGMPVRSICLKFARLSLPKYNKENVPRIWRYHPQFGAYGALE